jgi:hypothetical protein
MPSNKSLLIAVIVLGVIAAVAVGSMVTMMVMRGGAPAPAASTAAPQGAQPAGLGGAQPAAETSGVILNDKELSAGQLQELLQTYGAAPPKGRYWYDARSGLYGYWGREAAGYIRPGHNFGQLSPRASNGDTGVFLNGREINMTEAQFFQRLFGVVYLGHFWLDGTNGNMGIDGNPTPLANLVLAMQQAQQRGSQGGGYHWRDGSGGVVSSEGNCTFAAIPGAPVYSTPGCG